MFLWSEDTTWYIRQLQLGIGRSFTQFSAMMSGYMKTESTLGRNPLSPCLLYTHNNSAEL